MKLEVCEKCEYFVQHYVYSNKFGLTKTSCGHCLKKQMKKKECSLFKETEKTYEKEISIFDEIIKYRLMLKIINFKIETLNSMFNNITKEIQTLNEKKHN